MRGIGAAAAAAARRHTTLPSSYAPAFSSFSGTGRGDGGFGRGRGRGLPPSGPPPRAPGRPISEGDGSDPFSAATPVGRGRGGSVAPSSPTIASFSGVGRGRGSPLPPPPPPEDAPKQPAFTKSFDDDAPPRPDPAPPRPDASSSSSSAPPLPGALPFTGAGRGVPRMQQTPVDKPPVENRFIRRREEAKQAATRPPSAPGPQQPKLSGDDAVKRALELLGGGRGGGRGRGRGDEDGGGRGDRGRGFRGRNRGRGPRRDDRRSVDVDGREAVYLGDKADGERLEKKLGEEKMKVLEQAFMEAADSALPHPIEDAYLDACHTNNMIEFEPQYHVNFANPDIDEKPPISLEEMLQKVKPFIVAYEGIQNQEEWEEAVKDVMARAPHMKELIDMYSGPDVVTAKQQEDELQRVANTLPENIPSSVKRFTDKTLLSLKNNPGWGFDKKCQFMDKFTRIVSEQYK